MEYPKALYLHGQHRMVANAAQEGDAREDGFTDWPIDAARSTAAAVPAAEQPVHQVDVDVLRENEARLADWEQDLRDRDDQLTARANELAAREEALAAAEAAFAEKQAAASAAPPAGDTGAGAPQELDREALKARAAELGIEFARNVTTEKLAELIVAAEAEGK